MKLNPNPNHLGETTLKYAKWLQTLTNSYSRSSSLVLYNRTEHSQGFSICQATIYSKYSKLREKISWIYDSI